MIWVLVLLTVFQLYLAFLVGYLLLLVVASWNAPPPSATLPGVACQRFVILVPAHNEERLLPDLLASLARLDYPTDLFQVHVVADNCTDQTVAVARRSSVQVHVRNDREHLGKGYALNWLLERLKQAGEQYDAVVFLDADSVVSPNFLLAISAHLDRGERVLQAYYSVRDTGQSWVSSLRYAALSVLHYLRPRARMALGVSVGLKGNGMVFAAEVMDRHAWTSSLTEDIELHMAFLLSGERVTFAPEAIVWGEMPDNLSNSTTQHMRWEQGKKQAARTYIPRLLAISLQELLSGHPSRAFLLWDAVMEFLQPPFSILAGTSLISLVASLAFFTYSLALASWKSLGSTGGLAAFNIILAVGILFGQGVYLFAGLRSVSAPKQVYINLFHAPQLIVWKTWQMVEVLSRRGQNSWIRTKRNEE